MSFMRGEAIRGRAFFGYFLCACKESNSRAAREPQVNLINRQPRRTAQLQEEQVAATAATYINVPATRPIYYCARA
jgi:hypothetical protein